MTKTKEKVVSAANEYRATDKWHMTKYEAAEFALDVCDSRDLNKDERFVFLVMIK